MTRKCTRRQFLAASAATGAMATGLFAPAVLRGAGGDPWGDLTGRLVYDGPAPPRKKLTVDKDVECCGKFDIRDESLMVGPDGGLANVFVYVRSRKVEICPELAALMPKRVTLDNRDCIFMPHCMAIWIEPQEFQIVNSDPVAQNVAFSPLGDVAANTVLPVGAKTTWKFQRKQNLPVPIACNYHPWESAYILPREDPYVAITAADGTFSIPKLPIGELEFQVWHERAGYLDTAQWPKGRFELAMKPGTNDLGTIKLSPALFEKK
jgi:hypothetical protein